MHFMLRELAKSSNPPLYPNINIDDDVTTKFFTGFSKHIKSKLLQDTLCTVILRNVMLTITRSSHIFYPAVCAHVHSIPCCHLELFTPIIVSLVVPYECAVLTNCMITLLLCC